MNFETILQAVNLLGSNLPAFKLIFDEAKKLFSEDDQEVLQQAYEDAMARSDAVNEEVKKL